MASQAASAAAMQSPTSGLDQRILAAKPAPESQQKTCFMHSVALPVHYLVTNLNMPTYDTMRSGHHTSASPIVPALM